MIQEMRQVNMKKLRRKKGFFIIKNKRGFINYFFENNKGNIILISICCSLRLCIGAINSCKFPKCNTKKS